MRMTFDAAAAATKRRKKPYKCMSEQSVTFDGASVWSVRVPILVVSENPNGNRFEKRAKASGQIEAVLAVLRSHLRGVDRGRITRLECVRISSRRLDAHDNLRQAFKHVVDAVCAWVSCGSGEFNRRSIGKFDDQLIGTGRIRCEYDQMTHERVPLANGIELRLHLGSPQGNTGEP